MWQADLEGYKAFSEAPLVVLVSGRKCPKLTVPTIQKLPFAANIRIK